MRYLLAFPKSGSTWIRYCIESITGSPVRNSAKDLGPGIYKWMGETLPSNESVCVKVHYANAIHPPVDDVTLLLRDPLEAIISYDYGDTKPRKITWERYIKEFSIATFSRHAVQYFNNIRCIPKYKCNVFYYEDIICKPDIYLRELLLNFASERIVTLFLDDYKYHKKICLEFKKKACNMHVCTDGDPEQIHKFRNLLQKDNRLFTQVADLLNSYNKRFPEAKRYYG